MHDPLGIGFDWGGGAGGASGFTPGTIAGLSGWWMPGHPRNVIASGAYSQLTDLSGAGCHLTEGVAANRPLATTDSAGKAVARFQGTNDRLSSTTNVPDFTAGVTVFIIFNETTHVNGAGLLTVSKTAEGSDNDLWWEIDTTFSTDRIGAAAKDTLANPISIPIAGATNGVKHWAYVTLGNSSGAIVVDGGTPATDTGTDQAFGGVPTILTMGVRSANGAVSSNFFIGDIYEAGVYNRVLDADELSLLTTYLAASM